MVELIHGLKKIEIIHTTFLPYSRIVGGGVAVSLVILLDFSASHNQFNFPNLRVFLIGILKKNNYEIFIHHLFLLFTKQGLTVFITWLKSSPCLNLPKPWEKEAITASLSSEEKDGQWL